MYFPKNKIEEIEFISIPTPITIKPMNNSDKLLKVCLDALDTDVTPQDIVKDDLACAEVMSTLIKKVLPDFPIIDSTKNLDMKLFTDKRFKRFDMTGRGRIIISPRTNGTHGHVGIFITDERIASNNSLTGKFVGNYTWQSWIKEFKERRGLKIFIYEMI